MKYYTYKITFKTLPNYFYYGRHLDDGLPYFGTPKSKWRIIWEFHEPQVEVLEWFDTFEEACEAENSLILSTWESEYSLNKNAGGYISREICREQGLQNHEKNFPIEMRRENGKNWGERFGPNLVQYASENGSKTGSENSKVMNSHPNTLKNARLQGTRNGASNGRVGLSKMPRETKAQNGKNTLAKHGGRISRAGAAAANSQRWQSTIDGYISTAGGVANHNRARGWDPSARVKL